MDEQSEKGALELRLEGVARLKLALAFGFGARDYAAITPAERMLLQVEASARRQEIAAECVEIVAAWFLEFSPPLPEDTDKDETLAAAFLEQIRDSGGIIHYNKLKRVAEDPDFARLLQKMLDADLIRSHLNGVIWGRRAKKALEQHKTKQAQVKPISTEGDNSSA